MEAVSIGGIAVEAGGATVFRNGNSCYLDMGVMTGSWKCGGACSPIIVNKSGLGFLEYKPKWLYGTREILHTPGPALIVNRRIVNLIKHKSLGRAWLNGQL